MTLYCGFILQTSVPSLICVGILIGVAILNVGKLNWSKLQELAY